MYVHLSTRPNMKKHHLDVFALPTLKLSMHRDADASNKSDKIKQHTLRVFGLQRRYSKWRRDIYIDMYIVWTYIYMYN